MANKTLQAIYDQRNMFSKICAFHGYGLPTAAVQCGDRGLLAELMGHRGCQEVGCIPFEDIGDAMAPQGVLPETTRGAREFLVMFKEIEEIPLRHSDWSIPDSALINHPMAAYQFFCTPPRTTIVIHLYRGWSFTVENKRGVTVLDVAYSFCDSVTDSIIEELTSLGDEWEHFLSSAYT